LVVIRLGGARRTPSVSAKALISGAEFLGWRASFGRVLWSRGSPLDVLSGGL
jgi:hypothetical protein